VSVASRDPSLVRALADQFDWYFDLWIVMHEDLRANAKCRAVFDALVEGLKARSAVDCHCCR
jgi:DNA-binding transcriptional LysR family regulator